MKYELRVGQDEGNCEHLFVIECGVPVPKKVLQVAALILDGGWSNEFLEEQGPVAESYVTVTEIDN